MTRALPKKSFTFRLGQVISSAVILLGAASASHAAEPEGEFAGSNARNGAEFAFTINPESCAVTINSNKKIRRFAFRNAEGRTILARGTRRQFSLTGFVAQLTAHPEGQISIRSADGKWTRLNAMVNLAFAECIAPDPEPPVIDWGTCPCVEEEGPWAEFLGSTFPQTLPSILVGTELVSTRQRTFSTRNEFAFGDGTATLSAEQSGDITAEGTAPLLCRYIDPTGNSGLASLTQFSSASTLDQAISSCRSGLYEVFGQDIPAVEQ